MRSSSPSSTMVVRVVCVGVVVACVVPLLSVVAVVLVARLVVLSKDATAGKGEDDHRAGNGPGVGSEAGGRESSANGGRWSTGMDASHSLSGGGGAGGAAWEGTLVCSPAPPLPSLCLPPS